MNDLRTPVRETIGGSSDLTRTDRVSFHRSRASHTPRRAFLTIVLTSHARARARKRRRPCGSEESSIRRFERGDIPKERGREEGREMAGKNEAKERERGDAKLPPRAQPPHRTVVAMTLTALLSSRYRHMVARARPRRLGRSRPRSAALGRTSTRQSSDSPRPCSVAGGRGARGNEG